MSRKDKIAERIVFYANGTNETTNKNPITIFIEENDDHDISEKSLKIEKILLHKDSILVFNSLTSHKKNLIEFDVKNKSNKDPNEEKDNFYPILDIFRNILNSPDIDFGSEISNIILGGPEEEVKKRYKDLILEGINKTKYNKSLLKLLENYSPDKTTIVGLNKNNKKLFYQSFFELFGRLTNYIFHKKGCVLLMDFDSYQKKYTKEFVDFVSASFVNFSFAIVIFVKFSQIKEYKRTYGNLPESVNTVKISQDKIIIISKLAKQVAEKSKPFYMDLQNIH